MRRLLRFYRRRFALQLWSVMMFMILICTASLWTVHFTLFEPNYADATATRIENSIRPYIDPFQEISAADADDLLYRLSVLTGGIVVLGDENGKLLHAYSIGIPGVPKKPHNFDSRDTEFMEENYRKVLLGESIRTVLHGGGVGPILILGIPVRYENVPAVFFASSSMSELKTVQELIRGQLILLSIMVALGSSLLALAFMRHFNQPIQNIKTAVNQIADGDLTAAPDIRREDELGQLSRSVAKLGKALQRLDVLRKELIANVSHELRSPLSLIIGYGEMVRDISWRDENERNDNLNLIIAEAKRLSGIVDDILDYSQLQAGFMSLNRIPCNLYEVVRSEVDIARKIARTYEIDVAFESDSTQVDVLLDVKKMSRVLSNLINNAINHTKDGATVTVNLTERADEIVLSVVNPGPIIPEEARELIWERYQRIQHQGGRREGSGIGLSIVSKILTEHGFKYGVDSANGCNIFWFRMPREPLEE